MKTILVANPKGGSGKTTLATNLAGYLAHRGERVLLVDLDRQRSATDWLTRRPEDMPIIRGWNRHLDKKAMGETMPDWLVVDSPAGMHGDRLTQALKRTERVIVPVQPSAFDMVATQDFLETLCAEKSVRKAKIEVAMIGMRVDARTRAASDLSLFLYEAGFPVLTMLRDAQIYVQAASEGLSLFDMAASRAAKELEQWQPLLDWLERD
ncbi:MAG: ParA family protein [Betaproteobacteria bacterium]|nr:ParA family protein [Betaproteobacteria bacterium]